MSEKSSIRLISGGLAGAAALAAGSGAYAVVVPASTPLPATLNQGAVGVTTTFNLDFGGVTKFIFSVHNFSGHYIGSEWVASINAIGNSAVAYNGPYQPYAYNLGGGVDVGSQTFNAGAGVNGRVVLASKYFNATYNFGGTYGQFLEPTNQGYIGLRFNNGGNQHYGWVEVRANYNAGNLVSLDILGAYWNTTPLGAIETGEVPAPGTLAALAFGAAAFGRRSRRLAS